MKTELDFASQDIPRITSLMTTLPHALIISGEEGLNTDLLANHLALSLASEVRHIMPETGKEFIGIQAIRGLPVDIRSKPSHRRVIIINPADTLTEQAQNALLKTLEDPTQNTHFILVCTNHQDLLSTVISRCQLATLHRLSSIQSREILDATPLDERTKQQILFLATGRPKLIRRLSSNPDLLEFYRKYITDAKTILSGNQYDALGATQKYINSRSDALRLIDTLLTLLKYRLVSGAADDSLKPLVNRVQSVETSLKANSNIRFSLLKLLA